MAETESPGGAPPPTDLAAWLRRLPSELATVVEAGQAISRRSRKPLYLVGGPVRDLALGRALRDLDLVVEGDGLAFAGRLAAVLGGTVPRRHPEFLTAQVALPDGLSIDVASTRSETYSAPAALPRVSPATLAVDLRRRDFTVNTLTIQLGPGASLRWIDPLGGWSDLTERRLRALHDASFADDPTRILRAVRLEARLEFRLEEHSEQLARSAIAGGAFAPLSGSRLREELLRLLAEPDQVVAALGRWSELGGFTALDRELVWGETEAAAMTAQIDLRRRWKSEGRAGHRSPERLLLTALVAGARREVAERVADRLSLAGKDRAALIGEERSQARRALAVAAAPHELAAVLDPLQGDDLILLAAGGFERQVERYLSELAGFRLAIRGKDLLAAGVPAGPQIGIALQRTRAARLDGEIGLDDELPYALDLVRAGAAN